MFQKSTFVVKDTIKHVLDHDDWWYTTCICDEMPRAKGPTTRAMARRIQEEWALNAHARPKMNFTWAKEDVKT